MSEQTEGWIAAISKALLSCRNVLQSVLFVLLFAFALGGIFHPPWAHAQLARIGLEVSEVSIAGVKLVASQSFKMSEALAAAHENLVKAKPPAGSDQAKAFNEALQGIASAQAALIAQSRGTKDLLAKTRLEPTLPESAWITVGRLTEQKVFDPLPGMDRTTIANEQIRVVTLNQDKMVSSDDNCTVVNIADVKPVTAEEMRKTVILLSKGTYDVLETHACPSIGNAKILSVRVALTPARVRLATYAGSRS
jgi:hypothetical protein